jgi:hypothetical protein
MKPISFLCVVVVSLLLSQSSRADEPMSPYSLAVASRSGRCFFKMVPYKGELQEKKYVITREAFGVAYTFDMDGNFKELWKTSGWYSFEAFLSDDGQYLVRMGPWNGGHEPKKGDLAVAFYKNGKLLKEYSVVDLVKDKSKIQATVSHYFWLDRAMGPGAGPGLEWDNVFHLKTIDGIMYQFDATTGEIKKTEKP